MKKIIPIREVLIDNELKDHGTITIRYTNTIPSPIKKRVRKYIKKNMIDVLVDAMNFYKYNREFKARCRVTIGYNPINSSTIKVVSTYLQMLREQGAGVLTKDLTQYNERIRVTRKLRKMSK